MPGDNNALMNLILQQLRESGDIGELSEWQAQQQEQPEFDADTLRVILESIGAGIGSALPPATSGIAAGALGASQDDALAIWRAQQREEDMRRKFELQKKADILEKAGPAGPSGPLGPSPAGPRKWKSKGPTNNQTTSDSGLNTPTSGMRPQPPPPPNNQRKRTY